MKKWIRCVASAAARVAVVMALACAGSPGTWAEDRAACGDLDALRAAFERHVEAFNTPRDIETVLDFEENMVEFGHGGHGVKDFASMSREAHRTLLVEGTARKELYEWTPDGYDARITEGAGLVWGLYVRRLREKGGETLTDRGRFTATYVCTGNGWRAVLWHRSPLRTGPEGAAP